MFGPPPLPHLQQPWFLRLSTVAQETIREAFEMAYFTGLIEGGLAIAVLGLLIFFVRHGRR